MQRRPDFLIVGMQRSGTLWLSAMLNTHPSIASFPTLPFRGLPGEIHELFFFNTLASIEQGNLENFARPLSDYLTKFGKVFADLVPLAGSLSKKEFFAAMVERYGEVCDRQRGDKKIVGESTPAYVFHLPFIDSLYPGIKKLCVLRDPKDRITSWHFSLITKRRREEGPIMKEFALEYVRDRITKEYEALLAYSGSLHCLTYEKLLENTPEILSGVCAYLGEEASEETLQGMIAAGSFEEMTRRYSGEEGRARGEEGQWREKLKEENTLYDVNPLRKGIAGDWKNHMSEEIARAVDTELKELQKEVFKKYLLTETP